MLESFLTHIRSVVVLHGILPSKERLMQLSHLPLIATDGAGSELIKLGITPQLILGDLDSFSYLGKKMEGVALMKKEDQNTTDFEKTMEEILRIDLLPALIVGVSGKELDHTLFNLQVIARYAKDFYLPFLATEEKKEKLGLFCHDHFSASLPSNTLISILPYPEAKISTKGLKWDVQERHFDYEKGASIRNRTQESTISIKVHSGKVLILFDI